LSLDVLPIVNEFVQDMGLATDVAQSSKTPVPLGEAAKEIYSTVVTNRPDLANKDFSSVYRFLKEQ